jgi:hypothetical protein
MEHPQLPTQATLRNRVAEIKAMKKAVEFKKKIKMKRSFR